MRSSSITLVTLIGSLALTGCKTSDPGEEQALAGEPPPKSAPVLANKEAQPAQPAQPAVQVEEPGDEPGDEPGEEPAGSQPEPAEEEDDAPADNAKTSAKADKRSKPKDSEADDEGDAKVNLGAALKVKRLVVAAGVSGREPVGAARSFPMDPGKRIFAFVEVTNPDQVASEIYISFFKDGQRSGRGTRVNIGRGARWRTWVATRRAKSTGTWHAVVRNGRQVEIARTSFLITAAAEPRQQEPGKKVGQPAADKQAGKAAPAGEQNDSPEKRAGKAKASPGKPKAQQGKPKAQQDKPKAQLGQPSVREPEPSRPAKDA